MKNIGRLIALILVAAILTGCQSRSTVTVYKYSTDDTDKVNYQIVIEEPGITLNAVYHDKKIIEGIPLLCQYPGFPTGCESATAVMALQYCSVDVTMEEFVDSWLTKDAAFDTDKAGNLLGPDPYEVFVGDPTKKNSYGCFPPVIKKAINENCSSVYVNELYGYSLNEMCLFYIGNDIPVLVWITMDMREITDGKTWTTPSGGSFTWPTNEHAALLVGYDEDYYYFYDPMYSDMKAYEKEIVKLRYEQMGTQALAVIAV